MITIIVVVLAYLVGCVNTGYYLVRWRRGRDLRSLGSGTLGARNTGRVLGGRGFALALAGDALKGAMAVAIGAAIGPELAAAAAVAVVVGHLLPAQLGFRGGKGLATMLGATTALAPAVAAAGLLATLLMLAFTRRSGPSSLFGVLSAPIVTLLLGLPPVLTAALTVMAALVLARHTPPVAARFAPPAAGDTA